MRRIRRENANGYESNVIAIIHTDATGTDVIYRITTIPERSSTGCLNEAMVTRYGIIKKGDVVDVLPDTSPGYNILEGTGWTNKVEKCNNGSTTMSLKFDVY